MRARIIVGVALVMALFCVGTFVSQAGDRAGQRQWTVVNFMNPVQVKDRMVMGPVLIVHDDEKMAHGEACTSFYRFDRPKGPQEEIVSFHCKPEVEASRAADDVHLYAGGAGLRQAGLLSDRRRRRSAWSPGQVNAVVATGIAVAGVTSRSNAGFATAAEKKPTAELLSVLCELCVQGPV